MNDENKPEVIDLVTSAVDRKPYEFGQNFNSIMADKLRAAIEAKEAELSQSIFNNTETQEDE